MGNGSKKHHNCPLILPSQPQMKLTERDTICALSTAPGIGGIAVVRISGPLAFSIVEKVFSRTISEVPSHTAVHGWIMNGTERLDEVVVTLFRSPKSYTGEDTAEISCHGSHFIQQKLLEVLLNAGARLANPGEYTMRAYLNGKMDLSQAEAVADMIASESQAEHKQALHQMRGGFSREINALRDKLIHFASLIELELDFAEEDVEFANRPQLKALIAEISRVVNDLKDSFSLGNALKNGVPVAILGAPNMGKSTLLNALLNEDRAIVSDIAGTTRDTVEDNITLGGIRFKFIDTAGIRNTDDTIEKLGIERSLAKAKEAAVLLLLFDAITTTPETLTAFITEVKNAAGPDKKIILLANKIDRPEFDEADFKKRFESFGNVLTISAKNKLHIDVLKQHLQEAVHLERINSGSTIVTNARHHQALTQASVSLADIIAAMENDLTSDLIAVDIRKTLYHLGEITGAISADDLLNSIFSKFCIGK